MIICEIDQSLFYKRIKTNCVSMNIFGNCKEAPIVLIIYC